MTPLNLSIKRGDEALALFPHSDLRTAKPRPALVVLADNLATISFSEIDRVIGSLPTPKIDAALRHTNLTPFGRSD